MSKSLSFDFDPIDQPAATDPAERETWCSLGIRIGSRHVSRIWDKSLQSERTRLYVPAFPIAEWLVHNWWAILNELPRLEKVPQYAVDVRQMEWLSRHCLRSADSALLLPALYLFHDGQSLRAEWYQDDPGSLPNMPGEFLSDGAEEIDANSTRESLTQFIDIVLDRVTHLADERVRELTAQWRAIQGADAEEQQFCTLAGRMGLDPYDRNEMTDDLARFLEQTITNPDDALVRDLTELARPDSIEEQWQWLTRVSGELQLGPVVLPGSLNIASTAISPPQFGFLPGFSGIALPRVASTAISPPQFGYRLARKIRDDYAISADVPLGSVEEVAAAVVGGPFRVHDQEQVPGQGIRAIVGGSRDGGVVTAGPQPAHPSSQRFLTARSLYHVLVTSQKSQRLVTDAYSWHQKASRAFAAELLAPWDGLARRIESSPVDRETIEDLGRVYNTSTMVITRQLENAGIPLSIE